MSRAHVIEVYRTRSKNEKQRYAWRCIAPNGKRVAWSGEGYTSKAHAERMARHLLADSSLTFEVRDRTGTRT